MYIVHFLFAWYLFGWLYHRFGQSLNPYILLGLGYSLAVALTYLVARFTLRFVENPGIAWGRSLVQRLD